MTDSEDKSQTTAALGHYRVRRSFLVGTVVIVMITVALMYLFYYFTAPKLEQNEGVNAAQSAEIRLAELNERPPASSASPEQKANYYSKLANVKADAKDYAGAAQAIKEKEEATTSGLSYTDYYTQARWYVLAKDFSNAKLAIQKCESALPNEDNDSTGYYKEDMVARLEALKREINE